jgi:hypothetical protein
VCHAKPPYLTLTLAATLALAACGPPQPVLDLPAPEADPIPEEGPERRTRPRMETPALRPPTDTFSAPPPQTALAPAFDRFSALVLEPVTLQYDLTFEGRPVGMSTVALAREGADWLATQTLEAGPATQRIAVRFTDDLTPLGLEQRAEGAGPDAGAVDLRVEDGRLRGTARMPRGPERALDSPFAAGTLLAGMDRWLLAGAELAPGRAYTARTYSPQRGAPVAITFRVAGEEQVTVPAGTFHAYRVEVSGDETHGTLWVRAERPHLILRQQVAGQPLLFELRSLP